MTATVGGLDVVTALRDTIAVAVAGSQWQLCPVDLGWPSRMEDTHVWVGTNLTDWEQQWVVSGLGGKDEYLTIPVFVYVRRRGQKFDDIKTVLDGIAKVIAGRLAEDWDLSGLVMLAQLDRIELDEGPRPEEGAREGGLTLSVRVHQFVTQ